MTASNPSNYFVHTLLRARDWQHRPEFDQVCNWWRGGGQGVCGLVGIGGAGKTAITKRFLQMLPGVFTQKEDLPKDDTLLPPNSTFIFSFYDAPNAETLFEELKFWLADSPKATEAQLSYNQLIRWLQNVSGLMVLDGLEKVQEDGTRGILGQLNSPSLRDFIKRAANGYFPNLSLVITTRFPLADLQEDPPDFFTTIPIDEIDIPTGIKLLRQRQVYGNDLELERIVKRCGCHALTVDLTGGYIKEYGSGDPATPLTLGTATELENAVRHEQDPSKRAVLKQGFRFARIAQRYRKAMMKNDPAALALLERICLFRLGVQAETLVAIFTGKKALKVSGNALAKLSVQQLQHKLDWLVGMRIVEATDLEDRQNGKTRTLYTIHPAVRDGFLQGIGKDAAAASHGAIRTEFEVSLGKAPGKNPADLITLDMLEEIVYHAIASGQVQEAFEIYWFKIGGYGNLGQRLGGYERGERICRVFGGGQSPEIVAAVLQGAVPVPVDSLPYLVLSEVAQAAFINDWALYLDALGRLAAAAHCFAAYINSSSKRDDWQNASTGNENLAVMWLFAGRLGAALAAGREALRLAEQTNNVQLRRNSYSSQGAAKGCLGAVKVALADFCQCRHWQNQFDVVKSLLYSLPGIQHTELLVRLGRYREAQRLTQENRKILVDVGGEKHQDIPRCDLVLADVAAQEDIESARKRYSLALNWALAKDSKEVLCWATLVKARIELAESAVHSPQSTVRSQELGGRTEALQTAQAGLSEGLKIARDCGYGLHYINLLLAQAHLHLYWGNPPAALADLRLALDDGLPANDRTGQPQLLAANDPECGYAWGIVEGLHLRAEALLLQAAQTLEADSFVPARCDALPPPIQTLITQAEVCLQEAMIRWRDLRDPEVSESNFIHPDTGEAYNYRAADTYQVQKDLQGGLLTRYWQPTAAAPSETAPLSDSERLITKRFAVALSFPGEHRPFVAAIADALAQTLGQPKVFYDQFYEAELARPNLDTYLQRIYHDDADLICVFICEDYNHKDWCHLEARAIRDLIKQRRDDEIMFIRVDDGSVDGVFSVDGYVDAKDRPAAEVADLICQRLQMLPTVG
jgi:tetratricopeptide (TPR) repeat protein